MTSQKGIRNRTVELMRRSLLIFGLLSLAAVWLAPLPQFGQQTFWAHMTMHMVVVAVAAPLLALGVAGGKFDPVPKAPKLFAPIPASIVELIAVWAWHAPVLHHAARHSTVGFVAEQSTFLLTGLVMWLSAFGGDSASASSRRAAGVIGLLLTSMHMTLLGALLALAPRPLFHHAEGHSTLTPLDDQHLGGAIMLLVGGISYLAGGLWLTLSLMRNSAVIRTEADRCAQNISRNALASGLSGEEPGLAPCGSPTIRKHQSVPHKSGENP